MQSFVILSYYSFWLISFTYSSSCDRNNYSLGQTISSWCSVNLVAVRFMFICVDSTAFVNYVNMAFAIKISRLMITSIMYHRLTLVLLYLQTKIYYQESVTQISSKSACIISARFSQLNNQTSNQLFKCNFGFAFRSSLVIIDKENVNLITYL